VIHPQRAKPAPGKTTRTGYGWSHQQKRAEAKKLVDAGMARCSRCGHRIAPGQRWHMDHQDHPLAHQLGLYRGPSHAYCNVRAARGRPIPPRPRAPALGFFNVSKKDP
jgi:hypothetical protein